ncbi:MAG: hypothetical protein K2V71_06285 [Methylotenera sp.]|nr:hypothetical protein [Methylotenera sp.]
MNQIETRLMNFRIPVDLKDQFNQICEYKNTKMSYQLKKLIKTFINKEAKKQIKPVDEPVVNTWGHLAQDPVTKIWSKIKGY